LLETEALLLESRTKLEKIRAKLQEIADLEVKLKVKTMGMSRLIKGCF
jgi:metal-sulfur cluster biosynthetic enzyme